MAAANYTPILLYASGTAGNKPSAGNLTSTATGAEIALNYADGALYFKNGAGNVQPLVIANYGGNNQTSVGYQALNSNSGANNTAIGYQAGLSNTTATENTYIGNLAGQNVTGGTNTAVGSYALNNFSAGSGTGTGNAAFGKNSMVQNTTGSSNAAYGAFSLGNNTTGGSNSALGYQALSTATIGANNVAVGTQALTSQTTADNNTAVGYQAGYTNTTGTQLTLVGYQAGYGANNTQITAIGYQAGYTGVSGAQSFGSVFIGNSAGNLATGIDNTVIGGLAGSVLSSGTANTILGGGAATAFTSASNNTVLGYQAMYSNATTSGSTAIGYQASYYTANIGNTAVGNSALYGGVGSTGAFNTAVGHQTLLSNTANNNTAVGYQAGYSNTTGATNVFIGQASGYANQTGTQNVFIGVGAGQNSNASAGTGGNLCVGTFAGNALTTGIQNTFVGAINVGVHGSGDTITSGSYNTIIGSFSGNQGGLDIRTASNYIVLSDGAGNPRGIFDNNGNFIVGTTSINNLSNGASVNNGFGVIGSGGQTRSQYNSDANAYFSKAAGYTSPYFQSYYVAGTSVGSITTSGAATLFNTTSDYRLKENVEPVTNALQTIEQLNPVKFDWVADGRSDTGFLAHEFQAVIPNSVTGEKDAVDADGNPIYQQMDNSGAIPYLVAAIKELKAEFDAYKATHP